MGSRFELFSGKSRLTVKRAPDSPSGNAGQKLRPIDHHGRGPSDEQLRSFFATSAMRRQISRRLENNQKGNGLLGITGSKDSLVDSLMESAIPFAEGRNSRAGGANFWLVFLSEDPSFTSCQSDAAISPQVIVYSHGFALPH